MVVPASHAMEIIKLAHNNVLSGHCGTHKTSQRVEAEFHIPQLRKKVSQYIKSCHECQLVREMKVKDRQAIQPMQVLHSLRIKTPEARLDDLQKCVQPALEGATSLLRGKTDDADRQDAVVSLLQPLIDHDDSVQLLTIDGRRDAVSYTHLTLPTNREV